MQVDYTAILEKSVWDLLPAGRQECMEIETYYMKYPITSLLPFKDKLDAMLNKNNQPVLQTH